MSVCITMAGQSLMARLQAEGKALHIDTFIFAEVPDLDSTSPIDLDAGIPEEHRVFSCPIPPEFRAYVNPNQVVYSALLGSDVGPFAFNWQGLYCTEFATLVAVATFPTVQKRQQDVSTGNPGNTLTRNFMLTFDGAKDLTAITVQAGTWQLDFTVRLAGIDERERLSNRDIYGRAYYFAEAWLLSNVQHGGQNSFRFAPGTAYVEGIRADLPSVLPVVPSVLPCDVWLDVCMEPQGSDVVTVINPCFVTPNSPMPDYVTPAPVRTRHYCQRVARIDADGTVRDLRPEESANGLFGRMAAHLQDFNNPHKTGTSTYVVSKPVITGPQSLKSGTEAVLSFTAQSMLAGGGIVAFSLTDPQGQVRRIVATNGSGTARVLVQGGVGDSNRVQVIAEDNSGNLSLPATHTIVATDNAAPDVSAFAHTVPESILQDSSLQIHFYGAVDEEGEKLSYSIQPADSGLLFSKLAGIAALEKVTMTAPKSSAPSLPVSFRVTVQDERGASAQVSIGTAIIGNRNPAMSGFTHTVPSTVNQGAAVTVRFSGATDPDGDSLTYSIATGSSGLKFSKLSGIAANEDVVMTVPGKVEPSTLVSFTVTASDGRGGTVQGSVSTTILGKSQWDYTVNGSFTAPVSGTYQLECVGGGGGGSVTSSGDGYRAYAGGGGGGYAKHTIQLAAGVNFSIVIGGGGSRTGNCWPGGCNNNKAGNGGTSSIGAYMSATGGIGGLSSSYGNDETITNATGGEGGNGYGGAINNVGGTGNAVQRCYGVNCDRYTPTYGGSGAGGLGYGNGGNVYDFDSNSNGLSGFCRITYIGA